MREKNWPEPFYETFLFQAGVLTVLSLVVFGAAIGFDFCLDDHDLFNKIHTLPGPIAVFRAGDIFQTYYRPLFILSLFLEHALVQAPWLHHLVNIVLHIVVAVLGLCSGPGFCDPTHPGRKRGLDQRPNGYPGFRGDADFTPASGAGR
jgi:hypothetical protein